MPWGWRCCQLWASSCGYVSDQTAATLRLRKATGQVSNTNILFLLFHGKNQWFAWMAKFFLRGRMCFLLKSPSPFTFLDHRETRSVSSEKANGIKNVRVTIPGRTAAKEGWDEDDLKDVVKWSSWSIADPVGWGWCGRPVVATVAMALQALMVACLWFSHSVHTCKAKIPNAMSNPEHQTVSKHLPSQVTGNHLVLTRFITRGGHKIEEMLRSVIKVEFLNVEVKVVIRATWWSLDCQCKGPTPN